MQSIPCILTLFFVCVSASSFDVDEAGIPHSYARLSRKSSIRDPNDDFVLSVSPLRNAQATPVTLLLQTWGSTASCLTDSSARSEHHLPGYEGDVWVPGVMNLVIPETL